MPRQRDLLTIMADHESAIRQMRATLARIGQGVSSIDDLGDVTITSVGTGEVLTYTGSLWENQTLAEAGIASAAHNHDAAYVNVSGDTMVAALNFDNSFADNGGIVRAYDASGREILQLISGQDGTDDALIQIYGGGDSSNPANVWVYADRLRFLTAEASPTEFMQVDLASELHTAFSLPTAPEEDGYALWFSGSASGGGIWFDDNGSKRINWNAGEGNWSFTSFMYHDVTNGDVFAATGTPAINFRFMGDADPPYVNIRLANGSGHSAGDPISWDADYYFYEDRAEFPNDLRLRGTGDAASGTNDSGVLVVGPSGSAQIRIDQNEIMAASGSSTATLFLNNDGGNVQIGGHTVPTTDNAQDLGNASQSWRRLYSWALYDESGNARLDMSAGTWFTVWRPDTDSTRDLGTSGAAWRTLYVGDDSQNGAAISWQQERTWTLYQRSTGASSYAEWQSSSNKTWAFGGVTSGEMMQIFHTTSGSVLALRDQLTDVGNVETLRLNRGSGTGLQSVGYFSSRAMDAKTGRELKAHITGTDEATTLPYSEVGPGMFSPEWIDEIEPRFYRRRTTPQALASVDGMGGWELGFLLEDLASTSPYLTTKPGEVVGGSPDEFAIMATLWAAVRDLRARVKQLEEAA